MFSTDAQRTVLRRMFWRPGGACGEINTMYLFHVVTWLGAFNGILKINFRPMWIRNIAIVAEGG